VTAAQISGATLALDLQGGGMLDFALFAPTSGATLSVASDGHGGTELTVLAGGDFPAA
jgi:hypothetical protein